MKMPHKLVSGCLKTANVYYLATLKDGGSHGVFDFTQEAHQGRWLRI